MGLQLLSADTIDGIQAKLRRADENIQNLNFRINAFLKERPSRAVGNDERQTVEELWQDRLNKKVPIGLSVITGEIIHHFRSCLDHLTWDLSSKTYRLSEAQRDIGFPILKEEPLKKNKIERYERKIAGIVSKEARDAITRLQPYHASDPVNEPLAIINDLDIVYKHRNLLLVTQMIRTEFTIPIQQPMVLGALDYKREDDPVPTNDAKLNISFLVAFEKFGSRENQSVISSLEQLCSVVKDVVKIFA